MILVEQPQCVFAGVYNDPRCRLTSIGQQQHHKFIPADPANDIFVTKNFGEKIGQVF